MPFSQPAELVATSSRRRPARPGGARASAIALVAVLLLVGLSGCKKSANAATSTANADCQTATTADIRAPKTKFVLHAGLAFGAFHRYIYKPYKAGSFQAGASGRLKTFIKAGLAGAFTYHELKLALTDAQADPTLSKLVAPITALSQRMQNLSGSLKSNTVNPADVEGTNTDLETVRQQSSAAGAPVVDSEPTSVPASCS